MESPTPLTLWLTLGSSQPGGNKVNGEDERLLSVELRSDWSAREVQVALLKTVGLTRTTPSIQDTPSALSVLTTPPVHTKPLHTTTASVHTAPSPHTDTTPSAQVTPSTRAIPTLHNTPSSAHTPTPSSANPTPTSTPDTPSLTHSTPTPTNTTPSSHTSPSNEHTTPARKIVRVRNSEGALLPLTPKTLKSSPRHPLHLEICTLNPDGKEREDDLPPLPPSFKKTVEAIIRRMEARLNVVEAGVAGLDGRRAALVEEELRRIQDALAFMSRRLDLTQSPAWLPQTSV